MEAAKSIFGKRETFFLPLVTPSFNSNSKYIGVALPSLCAIPLRHAIGASAGFLVDSSVRCRRNALLDTGLVAHPQAPPSAMREGTLIDMSDPLGDTTR